MKYQTRSNIVFLLLVLCTIVCTLEAPNQVSFIRKVKPTSKQIIQSVTSLVNLVKLKVARWSNEQRQMFNSVIRDIKLKNEPPIPNIIHQGSGSGSGSFKWPPEWDSSRVTYSTTWPEDPLDYQGWVGFIFFLVTIFLIPLIVWLICQCIVCCICGFRCVGLCGGKTKKEGYSTRERKFLLIPYVAVFISLCIVVLLGVIFTGLFWGGVVAVVEEGFSSVDKVIDLFDGVINEAELLMDKVLGTIGNIKSAVASVGSITEPIDGIASIVNGTKDRVGDILPLLDQISSNITIIQEKTRAFAERDELDEQPQDPDIPKPNQDNEDSVTDAQNSLDDVIQQMIENKQTLTDAITQLTETVDQIVTQGTDKVEEYANITQQYLNLTKEYAIKYIGTEETRASYLNYTKAGIYSVMSVIIVFFVFIIIIYSFGIGAILVDKRGCRHCLNCISCYTISFLIIYFALCAIQLVSLVNVSTFCQEHMELIGKLDDTVDRIGMVSLPDDLPFELSVSNFTKGVLTCKDNETFLDVVGFSIDSFNITQQFDAYVNQFQNSLNDFDLTDVINEAIQQISNFTTSRNSVRVDYSQNITHYETLLDNMALQFDDLSRFNFSEAEYNASLARLNNASMAIGGGFWTFENYTYLDTNEPPFNESPERQQEFEDYKEDIRIRQSILNATLEDIAEMRKNVSEIKYHMQNVQHCLNETKKILDDIDDDPQQVEQETLRMRTIAEDIRNNVTRLISTSSDIVKSVLGVTRFAQCNWIGDFYRNAIEDQVCTRMTVYTSFTTLSLLLIGIVMTMFYIILLMTAQRVGRAKKTQAEYNPDAFQQPVIDPVVDTEMQETKIDPPKEQPIQTQVVEEEENVKSESSNSSSSSFGGNLPPPPPPPEEKNEKPVEDEESFGEIEPDIEEDKEGSSDDAPKDDQNSSNVYPSIM